MDSSLEVPPQHFNQFAAFTLSGRLQCHESFLLESFCCAWDHFPFARLNLSLSDRRLHIWTLGHVGIHGQLSECEVSRYCQNKPKILAQPYGVYFAVSLSIAQSEFEMDLLRHPLLRSLWHYVNTQLISPDQQISKNPGFLQVLTLAFDNQHLVFTYPLNFYRGSKEALSFSSAVQRAPQKPKGVTSWSHVTSATIRVLTITQLS